MVGYGFFLRSQITGWLVIDFFFRSHTPNIGSHTPKILGHILPSLCDRRQHRNTTTTVTSTVVNLHCHCYNRPPLPHPKQIHYHHRHLTTTAPNHHYRRHENHRKQIWPTTNRGTNHRIDGNFRSPNPPHTEPKPTIFEPTISDPLHYSGGDYTQTTISKPTISEPTITTATPNHRRSERPTLRRIQKISQRPIHKTHCESHSSLCGSVITTVMVTLLHQRFVPVAVPFLLR